MKNFRLNKVENLGFLLLMFIFMIVVQFGAALLVAWILHFLGFFLTHSVLNLGLALFFISWLFK